MQADSFVYKFAVISCRHLRCSEMVIKFILFGEDRRIKTCSILDMYGHVLMKVNHLKKALFVSQNEFKILFSFIGTNQHLPGT